MSAEQNVTVIATRAGVRNRLDPEGTVEIVWPEGRDTILELRVGSHEGTARVFLDRQLVAELVMALAAAGHQL